jgi:hypothetical protein
MKAESNNGREHSSDKSNNCSMYTAYVTSPILMTEEDIRENLKMLRKSREEKSVAYMGTQNTVILRT